MICLLVIRGANHQLVVVHMRGDEAGTVMQKRFYWSMKKKRKTVQTKKTRPDTRVRVGRGCICGHLIIWSGAVRPKTAKKTKNKKKVKCDGRTDGRTDRQSGV